MQHPQARADDSFLRPGRPVFKVAPASDAVLRGLEANLSITSAPERQFWDQTKRCKSESLGFAGKTGVSFGLRLAPLPGYDIKVAGKPPPLTDNRGPNALAAAAEAEAAAAAKLAAAERAAMTGESLPQEPAPLPMKRPERYYLALLKAEKKRLDQWNLEAYEEQIEKNESAAARTTEEMHANVTKAAAAAAKANRSRSSSSSETSSDADDSDSEKADDEEEEEIHPLRPFDGTLKFDIEIVVKRAPGQVFRPEEEVPSEGRQSTAAPSSTKSSESTPRMDLAAELQDLQDLMEDDTESDASSGLPDGLGQAMPNIYDNPDPRLALGIGGTVFFIPDAERYAFGPSLPPPPPPSLMGRRRIRLKPRLPLDISHGRYRDEHPNIWPEDTYDAATAEQMEAFERKVMTFEFFRSCSKALTSIPRQSFASEAAKHRKQMGKFVDKEIKRSHAWKEYIHRKRTEHKAKKKREAEEAAAAEQERLDKEKADREAAAQLAREEEEAYYS